MELTADQLVDGLTNDNILERERAGIKLHKALSDPGEHQWFFDASAKHAYGNVSSLVQVNFEFTCRALLLLTELVRRLPQSACAEYFHELLFVCAARADDAGLWGRLEEAAVACAASDRWTCRLGGVNLATASASSWVACWQALFMNTVPVQASRSILMGFTAAYSAGILVARAPEALSTL